MDSRWSHHLVEQILPWWERNALTPDGQGVATGFDNHGTVTTTDKFTWSQGRWAWVSAQLAHDAAVGLLPLDPDLWRSRALATCEWLLTTAVRDDDRCHFRVTAQGEPVADDTGETATSVFADLFCVLGLSGGLGVLAEGETRRDQWEARAAAILESAWRLIRSGRAPSAPYPVPAGYRDLAGPMTLLHTAAEALTVFRTEADLARQCRDWALERLVTAHLQGEDWHELAPDSPSATGTLLTRHRTPGHLLELLWMVDRAQAQDHHLTALPAAKMHALAASAFAMGWDEEFGGLLRYCDKEGGAPRGDLLHDSPYEDLVLRTWETKLWWVNVEAMYTLRLFAPASSLLAAAYERIAEWTMATFPDLEHGEWLQIRNRQGEPLNEVVALPVKDPFHIIRAMILLHRLEVDATPRKDLP